MFFGCFRRCLEHLWENGKKTNLRLNFWDDNYQNGHQFANNISQICFHLFCVRLKVAKHCGGCPTVPSPSVIHQAVVTCLPDPWDTMSFLEEVLRKSQKPFWSAAPAPLFFKRLTGYIWFKNVHCKKQEFSWIDNLVFQKKTWEQLEKRIADKQMSETRDQEKF